MARPKTFTQVSNGSTAWIPVDSRSNPFNLSFGCVVVSGTPTYKVEHTFDNVLDSSVTATAFTHEFVSASTSSDDGNYAFPVSAIRLTISSGNGTVAMRVHQPGSASK
jgi:hypothetical protein